MKIVQIDGIRGLMTAVFIGVCLFAGFVIFPGLVCMHLWNKFLAAAYMFPVLNVLQGVLLWTIAVISYSILFKNSLAVSFFETPELSDEDLEKIISSARFGAKLPIMRKVMKSQSKMNIKKIENIKKYDNEYISSPINSSSAQKNEFKEDEKITKLK